MTTQDYLNQIRRYENMIERKKEEIERLDIMICSIPANEMNPNKVQTSMVGDKMSTAVAKIVDAEKEVEEILGDYLNKRAYIISQIDRMPNSKSYMYLNDIYVANKSIKEVAIDCKCSEISIKKGHAKALKEFEGLYGNEYLNIPAIYI